MKDRDNSIYKNVSCSDSLYDHKKHLDLFHPKNAGIDQFCKSNVMRHDDQKVFARLKEFKKAGTDKY